jgi:hypothetical protein
MPDFYISIDTTYKSSGDPEMPGTGSVIRNSKLQALPVEDALTIETLMSRGSRAVIQKPIRSATSFHGNNQDR